MQLEFIIFIGILIPFIGTILGSGMVFFLKKEIHPSIQRLLLGFAAGVMIAASIWSLLIPSIDMARANGSIPWLPAVIGFLLGMAFLLILDSVIPHLHVNESKPEGLKSTLDKSTMLMLAVTLHNIPEGMAVGVVYASLLKGDLNITLAGAIALSIGIAIQNFPEGAIISMPIKSESNSKWKCFSLGALSGIVEPIAAFITILLTNFITPILPYLLAFAAGAMMYVVSEELIPQAQGGEEHSNIGTVGLALGFVIMMILDVYFS